MAELMLGVSASLVGLHHCLILVILVVSETVFERYFQGTSRGHRWELTLDTDVVGLV